MKKKQTRLSLTGKKSLYGFSFTIPWIIGFLTFFLIPIFQSFWYSFCDVKISPEGLLTRFVKLEHWKFIFFEYAGYTDQLAESITTFLYKLPIIIFLSVCLAIVLNQKFKGRAIFRVIFFIPAIIASGVVMQMFSVDSSSMSSMSGGDTFFSGGINFDAVLIGLGLPEQVTNILNQYISQVSSLVWSCGVQIILVLSGLQSISPQLYEASHIEGATSWENFWFITFPMLSNVLLVVVFYTTIDIFTNSVNPVMSSAYYLMMQKQNYSDSSVMLWGYFLIIGVIFSLILFLMNKFILKKYNG